MTSTTLSPAQKAAATRKARLAAAAAIPAAAPVTGFCDAGAVGALGDDDLLALFSAAADAVKQRFLIGRQSLSSWNTVLDYLRAKMAFRGTEEFRVLFLDKKNCLIADEALGVGTVDHCPVYPREVAKRALELNATALILVHNHPSGDTTPSSADVTMTKTLKDVLGGLGIAIHDHIIIGRNEHTSMKGLRLF